MNEYYIIVNKLVIQCDVATFSQHTEEIIYDKTDKYEFTGFRSHGNNKCFVIYEKVRVRDRLFLRYNCYRICESSSYKYAKRKFDELVKYG